MNQLCEPTTPRQDPQRLAEQRLARKLDLWSIRGRAARIARMPRQPPPLPRSTAPEIRELVITAWLIGYDGSRGAVEAAP
jgi:hypothetical protein